MADAAAVPDLLRALVVACADGPCDVAAPVQVADGTLDALLERDRVANALFEACESGFVTVADDRREDLRSAAIDEAVVSLALTRSAGTVADALADAGIGFRFLKGIATAHVDYRRPELRGLSDVDVLVAPGDFSAARRVLEAVGFARVDDVPRDRWTMEHAATLVSPERVEVDLHHRLLRRAPGMWLAELGPLLGSRSVSILDRPAPVLSDEGRLLHAACHQSLSRPLHRRMSGCVDIALLCRRREVVDAAADLAARVGLSAALRAGLQLAGCGHEVVPPDDGGRHRGRDRMLMWAYPMDTSRRQVREEVVYRATRSLGDSARDLMALVAPGGEYLDRRSITYRGHLARVLSGRGRIHATRDVR